MTPSARLAFCLLLPAAGLFAAEPAPGRVAVKAARLIDGRGGAPVSPAVVLIEGGKIAAVGPNLTIPPDAKVVDLGNATLLPGLIEMHDHLTGSPANHGYQSLAYSTPREAIDGVAAARTTLFAGFTTVRNVGAGGYADVALRDAINAGEVPGPRLVVSGPALGITGGHCDNNLLPAEYRRKEDGVADGPWEARAKVREIVKYGADVIKICASGGVLSKGDQPGHAAVHAGGDEGDRRRGAPARRKVAAHAHGTQSIKEAIRPASTRSSTQLHRRRRHRAWRKSTAPTSSWTSTTTTTSCKKARRSACSRNRSRKRRQLGRRAARELSERRSRPGVKMAFGTDAGVYPHGDNAQQFAYMVKWGMTPMQAIQAATVNAADLLGWRTESARSSPANTPT